MPDGIFHLRFHKGFFHFQGLLFLKRIFASLSLLITTILAAARVLALTSTGILVSLSVVSVHWFSLT